MYYLISLNILHLIFVFIVKPIMVKVIFIWQNISATSPLRKLEMEDDNICVQLGINILSLNIVFILKIFVNSLSF